MAENDGGPPADTFPINAREARNADHGGSRGRAGGRDDGADVAPFEAVEIDPAELAQETLPAGGVEVVEEAEDVALTGGAHPREDGGVARVRGRRGGRHGFTPPRTHHQRTKHSSGKPRKMTP